MRFFDILLFGALNAPILGLPTTDSLSQRMVKDPYKDCVEYPLNPTCPQPVSRAVDASVEVSALYGTTLMAFESCFRMMVLRPSRRSPEQRGKSEVR